MGGYLVGGGISEALCTYTVFSRLSAPALIKLRQAKGEVLIRERSFYFTR